MGDDIRSEIINEKSLLMANHQSTSDVLLIMAALDGYSSRHMWIMDRRFLKTHVGLVCCPDVSALGHYRTISALTLHHFGTDMQLHREMVRMKL